MIIVEDGSGKVDANSYVSVDDLKNYLLLRGNTSTNDASISAAAILAADYLETCVVGEWIGEPLNGTQALSWPRVERNMSGEIITTYGVPSKLKTAQCLLAKASLDGTTIMPVKSANGTMIEETVGPITTKYADTSATDSVLPVISGLNGLLASLLNTSSVWALRGVRV